jgi:hypothetical protein
MSTNICCDNFNELYLDLKKLDQTLDNLVPTKESIRNAKNWMLQRTDMAKEIASRIKSRVEHSRSFEDKLNVIYVLHDVLHHSCRNRKANERDPWADAFEAVLPSILRRTYKNEPTENQEKVAKVLFYNLLHT